MLIGFLLYRSWVAKPCVPSKKPSKISAFDIALLLQFRRGAAAGLCGDTAKQGMDDTWTLKAVDERHSPLTATEAFAWEPCGKSILDVPLVFLAKGLIGNLQSRALLDTS